MNFDPRMEAAARVGGRFDARVLEPSPPAVADGPWFADDPVNAPVTGGRPVVSPVANGTLTWDALAAAEPALAGWCADRWLGAWRRLDPITDLAAYTGSREALRAIAERVVAPARERANGKIGLRFTRGGFGTPFFRGDDGVDTQVRVDGTDLVTVVGSGTNATATREPLPTALASLRGNSRRVLTPKLVGDWFGFACSVLEELRCEAPDGPSTRVQLWPEHFDLAIDLGDEAAGRRGTFGASPGDDAHPEPYLYVTHWAPVPPDPFWNDTAFDGASIPYAALLAAADQRAAALEFLRAGRAVLGHHTESNRS